MNMHKQRSIGSVTKSALTVVGLVALSGWLPMAYAQNMQFAQKSLGSSLGEADSTPNTQFRSTIIDPSRPGKSMMPKANNTLRVIPISNPEELAGQQRSCTICGTVESISMMLNDRQNPGVEQESAVGDISKIKAKGKSNLLLTRNGFPKPIDAGDILAQQANKTPTMYEIKIRMNNGTFRIVTDTREPDYTVGDYVRVISGAVTAA
ncbi:MAG TPA: hypothetical protein VK938_10710 [Methylophilaceae bacterium]|nr:hypothetical protein [Methylophilaceae bacterium]